MTQLTVESRGDVVVVSVAAVTDFFFLPLPCPRAAFPTPADLNPSSSEFRALLVASPASPASPALPLFPAAPASFVPFLRFSKNFFSRSSAVPPFSRATPSVDMDATAPSFSSSPASPFPFPFAPPLSTSSP